MDVAQVDWSAVKTSALIVLFIFRSKSPRLLSLHLDAAFPSFFSLPPPLSTNVSRDSDSDPLSMTASVILTTSNQTIYQPAAMQEPHFKVPQRHSIWLQRASRCHLSSWTKCWVWQPVDSCIIHYKQRDRWIFGIKLLECEPRFTLKESHFGVHAKSGEANLARKLYRSEFLRDKSLIIDHVNRLLFAIWWMQAGNSSGASQQKEFHPVDSRRLWQNKQITYRL